MKPNRHEICISIGFCIGIVNESGVIPNKWYQSAAITPTYFQSAHSWNYACQSIARLLHQSASRVACIVCVILLDTYLTLICNHALPFVCMLRFVSLFSAKPLELLLTLIHTNSLLKKLRLGTCKLKSCFIAIHVFSCRFTSCKPVTNAPCFHPSWLISL